MLDFYLILVICLLYHCIGTWDGVCARCLLNIFGVIMYLRVGFIVAESGIYEAVAIIIIASAVTLITTLSMSALCTNGVVLGGGAYVCQC